MADELTILTENVASDSWVDAIPSAVSTGYQAQNTNINANRNGIDLSYVRYDSGTDEIVIEESGPIDDNGLPFAVGTEIRFANPGAGTWYLRVIPGSTTVDRSLEITASKGTWDGSKNGLYDGSSRRVLNWVIIGGSGAPSVSKLIPLVVDLINSYRGKSDITISNYDNDSAPVVKAGSVFDNNGILINVTSDATPTGYSGISVSTTFYLYWDESAGVFIYSATAPTWSDDLQGWYNGDDRALFFMYKDALGTLYASKQVLKRPGEIYTKLIDIGDWDMDTTGNLTVAHEVPLDKISSIDVIIRNDANSTYLPLVGNYSTVIGEYIGGYYAVTSAGINLLRTASGLFDSSDYNSTSYNRGRVTVTYEQ